MRRAACGVASVFAWPNFANELIVALVGGGAFVCLLDSLCGNLFVVIRHFGVHAVYRNDWK